MDEFKIDSISQALAEFLVEANSGTVTSKNVNNISADIFEMWVARLMALERDFKNACFGDIRDQNPVIFYRLARKGQIAAGIEIAEVDTLEGEAGEYRTRGDSLEFFSPVWLKVRIDWTPRKVLDQKESISTIAYHEALHVFEFQQEVFGRVMPKPKTRAQYLADPAEVRANIAVVIVQMERAKTPSSKSRALNFWALAVSPTITGVIGVSLAPVSKPACFNSPL